MNAWRLMLGTLTAIRVAPPTHVRGSVPGRAMALAPLGGLVLAALTAVPLALLMRLDVSLSPWVIAPLVLAVLALLTRGMHLDGLADTADGLGSGRTGEAALEVMRKSDIGPFGVVTLVLALVVQTAALADATALLLGPLVLTIALVVSRGVLPILCGRGFRPARRDGLGSTVAQSVTGGLLFASMTLVAGLVIAVVVISTSYTSDFDPWWPSLEFDQAVRMLISVPISLAPGVLLALRAKRRFGGVTGDVYGAGVEVTFTASLVCSLLAL